MAQAVIGALRVNLGIDSAQFNDGLSKAQGRLQTFERSMRKGALVVGAFGAAAVSAAAAVGVALTKASLTQIDAQSKLAARVGGSVAAIQTLQHAAGLAGVSQEQLTKAVEKLNERLGEAARKGAGPAAEMLQRLGLEAESLASLDVDQRLAAIADRMAELGYTTAQQADVLRQFGIRNAELINLLNGGGDAIRAARSEIEQFGLVVSDVDAATIERANDAMSKIGQVLKGIGNQIAVRVGPLIEMFANGLVDAGKQGDLFGRTIDKAIEIGLRAFAALNREVYNTRITIDELIGTVLDLFDTVAGAPPKLISWLTGGRISPEDLGFEEINQSFGKLRETLEAPPSDEEWIAWYDGIRQKAEETSQAVVAARQAQQASGFGGFGGTEADDRAAEQATARLERLQEQANAELDILRQSLLSAEELERNSYAQRMIDLQDYLEKGMITKAEYDELERRQHEEHWQNMRDISDRAIQMELRARQDMLNRISGLMGALGAALQSAGEENFKIVKALSLAQAILKGYEAITSSYAAGAAIGGPPLGAAYAGIAAATTAAQIAQIAATQPNSKSSGGSAASSAAPSAQGAGGQGVSSSLYIEGIDPGSLYSGVQVRELAERLVEYQRDGGTVVFSGQ